MTPDDEDQSAPARFGRWINQLDIDFSRFTLAGWLVAIGSLVLGGLAGYGAYSIVEPWAGRQAVDAGKAGGLSFFIAMVVVTVFAFQGLRAVVRWSGGSIVRDDPAE